MMPTSSPASRGGDPVRLHRAIFRLHFYAGLIVAPFLLVLSITGIIYLFNTEIDDALHPSWRFVEHTGPALPVESIVGGALAAHPGTTATRVDLPTAPERTALVFLKPAVGETLRVHVDPVTGKALGAFTESGSLVGAAGLLHGSLMMGERGDLLVELASCWTIVLLASGLFLWWPRTPNKVWGVWLPRISSGRPLWRDLHAVTGMWGSAILLFLLLTGLPWASNWGANLNRAMASAGLGYPASYRSHINHVQTASTPHSSPQATLSQTVPGIPWTLEQAPAPHSHHAMEAAAAEATPIGVGQAAQVFAAQGLTTAYRLVYPKNANDVFTAYTYPDRPQGQRTIHLDQYTGEVLNDVRFADYGAGAKAVELGVQLHMGNYFGFLNQLVMLLGCLAGIALALTGPAMWLSRRQAGLGAPRALGAGRPAKVLVGGMIALGLLFPVLGLSALLVIALERFVLRRVPGVSQWLGLAA